MKELDDYERYLSQVDSYLSIAGEAKKELAALEKKRDAEKANVERMLAGHQKSVERAVEELEARFLQQSRQLAMQHIDGVALPERVRPSQTECSFEELIKVQSSLLEQIRTLLSEYKTSIDYERVKERRFADARARRNAVLEARRIEGNFEETGASVEEVEDNGEEENQRREEKKAGCLGGVMSIAALFLFLTSLLLK